MQTLRILFVCLLLGIGPVAVTLAREVKILDMNGQLGDTFGYVSISGDTAIVGAPRHDGNKGKDSGSVYVFVNIGRRWKEQATFTASDVNAGDQLGTSVAIRRDTVIVGAPAMLMPERSQARPISSCAVGKNGNSRRNLPPAMRLRGTKFGTSVAIFQKHRDCWRPIGADGGGKNADAAYSFQRTGTSWEQRAKVIPSDAADSEFNRRDWGRELSARDYGA